MADLKVNEKGAGNRSLDHPSFGDVNLTEYKKGVISDFKVDDPSSIAGTIHSLVKIDLDGGGQSDWLPLFYRPKALYWDDPSGTPLATDYNESDKCYEKAWMAFRCGDEVRVMQRKGVPYAVVGFWEGPPRIGEDIVRCEYENGRGGPHSFYFRSSTNNRFLGLTNPSSDNEYDVELSGPEEKPLNLRTEIKPIVAFNKTVVTPLHNTTNNMNDVGGVLVYSQYAGNNSNYFIHEWRIPVGPILHIIQVISVYQYRIEVDNTGWHDIGSSPPGYTFSNPIEGLPGYYATLTTESYDVITLGMYIQTALFNKDRNMMNTEHIADPVGAVDNNNPWWFKYPDFEDNPGLLLELFYVETDRGAERDPRMVSSGTKWISCPYYNADGSFMDAYQGPHHSTPWYTAGGYAPADEYDTYYWEKYGPDWATAKFMVRPHTKEEMQEAGMLPSNP